MIEIDVDGSANLGRCECCGNCSRRVWGYARRHGIPFARYFVHWTIGHVPEHGANFDLIIGRRGEGTAAPDRYAASLAYWLLPSGPGFMVIDSPSRSIANSPLVGRSLQRVDIVGQPIAQDVFALCDAILDQDDRLAELFGGAESEEAACSTLRS